MFVPQHLARIGALLSILGLAQSAVVPRSGTTLGRLYAYGTNITGLPIFYSNAVAYIGDSGLLNSSAVDVNFTLSSTSMVAKSDSASSTSSLGSLAMDTASNAFDTILFSNSTTQYTTTGFYMYGSQVTWEDANGLMETNFVAVPSSTVGLWTLKWNAGSVLTDSDETVLVNVKNIAPPSLR